MSVKLRLYCYSNYSVGGGSNVAQTLHRVTSTWDNNTTWNSRPTTVLVGDVPAAAVGQKIEIDISSVVRAWKAGTPNEGIMLRPKGNNNQWNKYRSSEATSIVERPALVIDTVTIPVPIGPGLKTAPGTLITTLTPTFSWGAVSRATGYELIVIDAPSGIEVYRNSAIAVTTRHILPEGVLSPGQAYRWTMRTKIGSDLSAETAPFYFTVSDNVALPALPVLLLPGSFTSPGTSVTTLAPTFTWRAAANALGYGLYIVDAATGTLVHSDETLGKVTKLILPTGVLQAGKSYRWNMRSRGAAGWGIYTTHRYFATPRTTALPPAPAIVSPGTTSSPGPVLTTLTPELVWKPVLNATSYGLYVSDTVTLQLVYQNEAVPAGDRFTLPASTLATGKTYRWNLRAFVGGQWSDYSPTRLYFQIPPNLPEPSIVALPLGDVTGSTSGQTIIIEGLNFQKGCAVLMSISSGPETALAASSVTFENSTRLRVSLVTGTGASVRTLRVRNPDGKLSGTMSFSVVAPLVGVLAPPGVDQIAGTKTAPIAVGITHPDGATIRYTLDGTAPTSSSSVYTAPLFLGNKSLTLQARAFKPGYAPSVIVSRRYDFKLPILVINQPSAAITTDNYGSYFRLPVTTAMTNLTITTDGGSGDCDLYVAFNRLPDVNYQFSSRQVGTTNESIVVEYPGAGDCFIWVKGSPTCAGVRLIAQSTSGIGISAAPKFSHTPGNHLAAIQNFSITSSDPGAQIYFSISDKDNIDAAVPDPGPNNASLYQTPLSLGTTRTVRARAYSPGKLPSTVTKGTFFIPLYDTTRFSFQQPANDIDGTLRKEDTKTFIVDTAVGVPDEHRFFFDVPSDDNSHPADAADQADAAFSVAAVFEILRQLNDVQIYVKRDSAPTPTSCDYSVLKLQTLDGQNDTRHVNIGKSSRTAFLGSDTDILRPGGRYYGLIVARGGVKTNNSQPEVPGIYSFDLRIRLLRAELSTTDRQPIRTGLGHVGISIHGRGDFCRPPWSRAVGTSQMKELGAALAAQPAGLDQVLLLDWSTMAMADDLLPINLSRTFSLSETAYVPEVGRRAKEMIERWHPAAAFTVVGHSWGSYVAFEMGKVTKPLGRLIALDPATTGTGGYIDSAIKFTSVAVRSWAFVSAWGLYGHEGKAATAAESFVILDDDYSHGGHYFTQQSALHSAPVTLFTQFLKNNYGGGTGNGVEAFFTLQSLDQQKGVRPWKENAMGEWSLIPNQFEGEITIPIYVNRYGLSLNTGPILKFKNRSGVPLTYGP